MLKNTFIHIQGMNKESESTLWQNDILSWDELLDKKEEIGFAERKKAAILQAVYESKKAYDEKNHSYFSDNMPSNMHWRAYPDFKDKACFLDIETTGLSREWHDITVIGVHDGEETKLFVKGKNMDAFEDELKKYSMIITYNGKCFDVPFIKSKFKNLKIDQMHVDLRYAMRELGYSGGLKRIEKEIGITRSDELDGVDGFEAVRLWKRYERGDEEALKLLLEYNKADVENLKIMMEFAFQKLKEKNFLSRIN